MQKAKANHGANAAQLTTTPLLEMTEPRSRRMRSRGGGGVKGGVMVAIGGMGSILMLSSASAPSRVPQVVCGCGYQSLRIID